MTDTTNYQQGLDTIHRWFEARMWEAFPFQKDCWKAVLSDQSGLLNAPTGSGKTFALLFPLLIRYLSSQSEHSRKKLTQKNRLRLLWVTPLRALAKDIERAIREVLGELEIPWEVARRTGDISAKEKAKLRASLPEILLITPESLHLALSQKDHQKTMDNLEYVVIDEWHELLGSKRGVQVELALAYLKSLRPKLPIWGISATIGNMDEALDVLLGMDKDPRNISLIRASHRKNIEVLPVIPDEMDRYPWAGHLGLKLSTQVLEIVQNSRSTLLFTNTRAQAEIWFRTLLDEKPELAGQIALHHGSLDKEVREWVEWALHEGKLKLVVCTSSLDLGVDFSPVETVIQVGSPKGVARFLQRAGRSGHKPGATSRIYFVPTHALELVEAAALRRSVEASIEEDQSIQIESRIPIIGALDVLAQFIITIALSSPVDPNRLFPIVKNTFAYQFLDEKHWAFMLRFVTVGGESLKRYPDYQKLYVNDAGELEIRSRRVAMRHRMSIGTITSEVSMRVKWMKGGSLGSIEEYFISRLNIGDAFWFAGRMLELVQIKDMTAYVRKTKAKKGPIPSWLGGRMSLSSEMSELLRSQLLAARETASKIPELKALEPVFEVQRKVSIIPGPDQFLIERSYSKEGVHLFFFPFEGRYVHEGLSALIAWRIAQKMPASFSIAMNDYGFELLSDAEIPIQNFLENGLFSEQNLINDIQQSLNKSELARRRFRDIARVAGMIFSGFPGKSKSNKNLQMSSGLLFDVLKEYEPEHPMLQQAFNEVLELQLDEARMRASLKRIARQKVVFRDTKKFTPFAFPIMVDRLNRDKISSEKLEDRIRKMIKQLEK